MAVSKRLAILFLLLLVSPNSEGMYVNTKRHLTSPTLTNRTFHICRKLRKSRQEIQCPTPFWNRGTRIVVQRQTRCTNLGQESVQEHWLPWRTYCPCRCWNLHWILCLGEIRSFQHRCVPIPVLHGRTDQGIDSYCISITICSTSTLLQVEGSAGYLEDDVMSDETVRVTSKYNRRSKSKTIAFNLDPDPMACAFSDATHVITEVTYGFNSYFVFEKSVSNMTSKREVEGRCSVNH